MTERNSIPGNARALAGLDQVLTTGVAPQAPTQTPPPPMHIPQAAYQAASDRMLGVTELPPPTRLVPNTDGPDYRALALAEQRATGAPVFPSEKLLAEVRALPITTIRR